MTAKEYLSQAYRLDQRINSKIEQIASLNHMAAKCTSVLSGMPGSTNKSTSSMSDVISKIVDLETEINAELEQLVSLKREIVTIIKSVNNSEYQMLLEHRYLCFHQWEQIALEMHYGLTWIKKMHERALNVVDQLLKEKCDRK